MTLRDRRLGSRTIFDALDQVVAKSEIRIVAKLRKLLPRRKRPALSRGEAMSRIRSKDTAPERMVRSLLSQRGVKYRMNVQGLSGKPDFANKTRKFAIFVHGCFWHSHPSCGLASSP